MPTANRDASPQVDSRLIWSPRYLDYAWTKTHPMNPLRLDLTMRLAAALGITAGVELIEPVQASCEQLYRVHSQAYVGAVKAAGAAASPPRWAGMFGLGNDDNPVFPHMHQAGAIIVGGTLRAAQEIAVGQATRAVSIGGGMHHAMAGYASGFCIYNDVAVAIDWLLEQGFERIAYLDVDVHHGDGVQRAFETDPRVLTVSIHQHPATLWPGTGYPSEIGSGPGSGYAINLALPAGTTDAQWLRAFHAVVPSVIAQFKPQIVVSQCGVDTHREDPLAEFSLTVDGQRAAFLAMRALADEYANGRWLAVGGGGYGVTRVVPRAWTHLIAAGLGRDIDPATPIPARWSEYAAGLMGQGLVSRSSLPATMSDQAGTTSAGTTSVAPGYHRWDGPGATPSTGQPQVDAAMHRVDAAILATRRATFSCFGLDPEDPRD